MKKKLKILQMIDERWDSGIVNYCIQLSKGLQDKGHEIVIAARKDKPAFYQAQSASLPVYAVDSVWSWIMLCRFIQKKSFDIINAHTGNTHTWAVLCPGKSAKIIRTWADSRTPALTCLKKYILNRTHAMITATSASQKSFKNEFINFSSMNIFYAPQGIDQNNFPYLPEPEDHACIRIGIVGRLDLVKGHRVLIEALAELKKQYPAIKLIVAGKEANVSIASLKEYAVSCGVAQEIDFLGYVSNVQDVMSSCHIGVIASTGSEAVSRALLEWMASGRAVVATRVGGIPDIIAHDINGLLVEPSHSASLAEALLKLIKEPDFRRIMGKYAQKSIETTFSLQRFVNQTESIYYHALEHTSH